MTGLIEAIETLQPYSRPIFGLELAHLCPIASLCLGRHVEEVEAGLCA